MRHALGKVAAAAPVADGDDAVGVRVRERTQQHAVHDAEHRGVAADA
jgi:hypothetical protein